MLIRNLPILFLFLLVERNDVFASQNNFEKISYQKAASYTHLLWNSPYHQPINIKLLAIQNYSGIPIDDVSESTEYYSHGKIPAEIDLLSNSLIESSRYFKLTSIEQADYQFQLIIEQYKLPHKYAPDDIIWQEFKDEVDRWLATEQSSQVKLTLQINSANKVVSTWSKSVLAQLTKCDLNSSPQPLMPYASSNQNLLQYVAATPAQAFIAATNFLTVEAINFLNSKNKYALIEKINGGEFFISSNNFSFKNGETMSVHQDNKGVISSFPIGLVEVMKSYENQATVYPLNFKPSQVRVGDKVAINQNNQPLKPAYQLNTKSGCGMVKVIDAVAR